MWRSILKVTSPTPWAAPLQNQAVKSPGKRLCWQIQENESHLNDGAQIPGSTLESPLPTDIYTSIWQVHLSFLPWRTTFWQSCQFYHISYISLVWRLRTQNVSVGWTRWENYFVHTLTVARKKPYLGLSREEPDRLANLKVKFSKFLNTQGGNLSASIPE